MDTQVVCRLQMDDEQTDKVWIRVLVTSQMKPHLQAFRDVDANLPEDKIRLAVAQAAEELACHHNIHYADHHNPQAVAKAAVEALGEIFKQAQKARRRRGLVPEPK